MYQEARAKNEGLDFITFLFLLLGTDQAFLNNDFQWVHKTV